MEFVFLYFFKYKVNLELIGKDDVGTLMK